MTLSHIVSYSGGMGSFAEAQACCEKYGKENVVCLFCDTLMEDEDLYRFIEETIQFLGCRFERLCYGLTPWELFKKESFIANSRLDLCSRKLKRDLMSAKGQWIDKNYGYESKAWHNGRWGKVRLLRAHVHVGLDYSEGHRLKRVQEKMWPWIYRSTLYEDERLVPKDWSEQFGIERPRLYNMGFGHNNCGGFCVKAGLGHFKLLYEKMPERYLWHEEQEWALVKRAIKPLKPFLRKVTKGEKRYLTMRQYRQEFLEKGKADEFKWDIGGCGCALID